MNEHREIPIYTNDSSLNVYQNELMNLLTFLKEVHPAFLINKSLDERISLMATDICNQLSDKVQWNLSKFQVWLNRLLVELQDAHSYIPLESSTLYPFIIRFWEGEFYIHSTIPSQKNTLGKVITHIANQEISFIHKQLNLWIPSENPIKSGISGSYFLNNPSFLEAIGISSSKGMLPMTFTSYISPRRKATRNDDLFFSFPSNNQPKECTFPLSDGKRHLLFSIQCND